MTKLYFSLKELCKSEKAAEKNIDNTPNLEQCDNMLNLIFYCLQPLRERIGKSVHITSGFRNERVNKLVKGKVNSQHKEGKAADIYVEGMNVSELIRFINNSRIEYDQLINEYDRWVHISYNHGNNRIHCFSIK